MADGGGEGRSRYFGVFGSLEWWSLIVLVTFAAVRSATYIRPQIRNYLPLPCKQIPLLAIAYVLFADNGAIDTLFGIPGSLLLPVALFFVPPYIAHRTRSLASETGSRRIQWISLLAVALTGGQPPALALLAFTFIASTVDDLDQVRYAAFLEVVQADGIIHSLRPDGLYG